MDARVDMPPAVEYAYPYKPLIIEPDAIRLLVIEPATTDDIQCSLIHTTLADCTSDMVEHFIALSYVWGDAIRTKVVQVDGHLVQVTTNLHDALYHVRHSTGAFRLWVDALCINQEDDKEKGLQVAMMMEIYKAAFRTITYLGTPSLEEAWSSSWKVLPEEPSGLEALQKKMRRSLLGRPWFRRVWVEQEVVSSRDPWVQYGGFRIHWDHLCRTMISGNVLSSIVHPDSHQKYARESTEQSLLSTADLSKGERSGYEHLVHLQLVRTAPNQGRVIGNTMFDILQSRDEVEATDPRDLIFAHSGIASDGLHPDLAVDYSKSCKQVFEDFARYQKESSVNFDIFSCIDHTSCTRLQGLATWAPNWIDWKKSPSLGSGLIFDAKRGDGDGYENFILSKKGPFGKARIAFLDQSTVSLIAVFAGVITYIGVPLYEVASRISGARQQSLSNRLVAVRHDYLVLNDHIGKMKNEKGLFRWDEEPFAVLCQDIFNT